jgi:hypothetical protein
VSGSVVAAVDAALAVHQENAAILPEWGKGCVLFAGVSCGRRQKAL